MTPTSGVRAERRRGGFRAVVFTGVPYAKYADYYRNYFIPLAERHGP